MMKRNTRLALLFLTLNIMPLAVHAEVPSSVAANAAPASAKPLPDADQFLANLVHGGIRPLYRELDQATQTLQQQTHAFCSAPNEAQLTQLQQAWGTALLAWQRTDALLFGPAVVNQLDFHIHFNPVKDQAIQTLLNDKTALTPDLLSKTEVGTQGFSALEYLLFERDTTPSTMLGLFQGANGERRCAYVTAASDLLQQQIHALAEQWLSTNADSYGEAFVHADKGNAQLASTQQALDLIINNLYLSAEKIAKVRIGLALGKEIQLNTENKQDINTGVVPERLEAWRSGYSIKIVHANVEGMMRIIRDGGITEWLRTHNRTGVEVPLADAMEMRLNSYLHLPPPRLDPYLLLQQGQGKALSGYYYLANDISMSIKRQLAKVLGASLGFADIDGD